MKRTSVLSFGALAVLMIAALTPSAQAACGAGAGGLYSGYSPIHSNPGWPLGASYCSGCGPAFSQQDIVGFFWHLGFGDQFTNTVGDDSGSWAVQNWMQEAFPPSPPYYYRGVLTGGGWGGDLAVDNCILLTDPNGCSCVYLGDDYNRQDCGQFLVMGSQLDPALAQFNYAQPGLASLQMAQIPPPIILGSSGFGNGSVDLNVVVNPPAGGVYQGHGNCDCAPVSYRIRAVQNPGGVLTSTNPGTRQIGAWPLLDTGVGTGNPGPPQPAVGTPLGQPVTVHAPCSSANQLDVYLVTELMFNNGGHPSGPIQSLVVSKDSPEVECGPNLADPEDVRPRRGIRNRKPRPFRRGGR